MRTAWQLADPQPHKLPRLDGLHRGWQDIALPGLSGYRSDMKPATFEPFIEGRMIQGAAFVDLLAADDQARRPRRDELLDCLRRLDAD